MRAAIWGSVAALIAASAAAQPTVQQGSASEDAPPASAVALAQSCSAHTFETTVQFTVDGERRQSKVKMCGTVGQNDAQWATTLRDAAKKVQANESMPQEARQQVVAAIEAELEKLDPAAAASAVAATTITLPRETAETEPTPSSRLPEYSTLPPLPSPAIVAASTSASATGAAPIPPRLTIRCLVVTDLREPEACSTIESNTQLEIRAEENVPAGLQLRFLRKGAIRGELSLAALRQGQTLRLRPPTKLCAGVLRSSAQIQILRMAGGTSQVLDTRGPFDLRC